LKFWLPNRRTGTDWTDDANKAVRFLRHNDANEVIAARPDMNELWVAREHIWDGQPRPAPDALRWEAIAKQWAHEAELARQPDKFYEKYDEKAMNAMQALLTQANAKTDALRDVMAERKRQDAKWGEQNHDPFTYLTVLMEEVGEFAQAALHARFGGKAAVKLREEAVHSAAVALAIVECIDRNKWTWSTTAFTAAEATP
jgi:NTP pyrophosphatase (non-canonical NTP hydrolase)